MTAPRVSDDQRRAWTDAQIAYQRSVRRASLIIAAGVVVVCAVFGLAAAWPFIQHALFGGL